MTNGDHQETVRKYADIIDKHWPEDLPNAFEFFQRHPRMTIANRAKIYAPFAALRGHGDRLRAEDVKLNRVVRAELSEENAEILSKKLHRLRKGQLVRITFFMPDEEEIALEAEQYAALLDRDEPEERSDRADAVPGHTVCKEAYVRQNSTVAQRTAAEDNLPDDLSGDWWPDEAQTPQLVSSPSADPPTDIGFIATVEGIITGVESVHRLLKIAEKGAAPGSRLLYFSDILDIVYT